MTQSAAPHLKLIIPPDPWTRAMEDGSVQVPGLTWTADSHIENAPARFVATAEARYDVGENGLRRYVLSLLGGAPPTAIPVFFGRELMQRNLLVRADSPLSDPRALAGATIGARLTAVSGTAAAVLMMLEQAYGLDLTTLELRMSSDGLLENRLGLHLTPGPQSDDEGFEQLASGELDVFMVTTGPRYWSLFGGEAGDDPVAARGARPLITDPGVMADAYRRTGLYPISDLVVVRPEVAAAHPEAPALLVSAFAEANDAASRYRDPEEEALARREVELLGEDPHRYELSENQRLNLAAYTDFFHRMGAIERTVAPEDLFAPATIG